MPSLPPGANKPLLRYFWARVLKDKTTVETQFDLETGEVRNWYPVPFDMTQIMWFPVYPEMSELMARNGEFGLVNDSQRIVVDLDPYRRTTKVGVKASSRFFSGCCYGFENYVQIGDEPVLHFEQHLHVQSYYFCHHCKNEFLWPSQDDPKCPKCGTTNEWECRRCGEIKIGKYLCPKCTTIWFRAGPYDSTPAVCPRCSNEEAIIPAGEIKNNPIFLKRGEVRCPDCEAEGHPYGLNVIENLEMRSMSWIETKYIIGIEGLYEHCITDQEIKTKVMV